MLAGAGTSAMRAGGCCLLLARTRGVGPPGANVISGNRAVTQHIWSRLPQKRWEPRGAPSPWSRSMVTCSREWWRASLGSSGRGRGPEPRIPGSLRAGVSRETQRLLLMQHNSPGSLPFSHNKHTAKSLASCFDEATCISPFSVYRKLLLKKVILVFTARVKGPGCLAPPLAALSGRRGEVPAGRQALAGRAARPGRWE